MILALKQALSESVLNQALIITATRRLAKQWQPILVSQKVNISPRMLSQSDWFNQIWTHLESTGLTGSLYLLNPIQESVLWKKIIESSSEGQRLLRVHATAKKVAQAFALLKQWDIPLEEVRSETEETQLFLQWSREFEQMLQERAWITQAELPNAILNCLNDWKLMEIYSPSKQIQLLGFEDISPQFQKFYAALKAKGWEVAELEETGSQAQHHKYAFYDQTEEFKAAALWAQSLKTKVDYPGAIGIVVPDLSSCRSQIFNIFTEILEPLSELHPEQRVSDQFNISVAQPLSSYPIVAAALKAFKESEEEDLFLKRSPFFVELKPLQIGVAKAPLTYWVEIFEQHLKQVGWPGKRVLNSIEHQAMARWQLLLGELAALDTVLEMQDLKGALQWLNELAFETPFQGQSKPAPIHIMGILEASSQPFEYLWITGLNNEAWPPIPRANPFLPIALQRSYNMPHASNEREYTFSKKLLEKLKQACNSVIMSYYKNDAVKSYYPSYLLSDLEEESLVFNIPSHPGIQHPAILESIIDNKGPSLVDGTRCKGGASVFQAQAVCPFKAFTHYRLKAKPKDKQVYGLSAQERGILVHKLVEQLWAMLKTSCQLTSLREAQLDKILEHNIQSLRWRYPKLGNFFWEVEHQRLKSILLNWLNLEKKRGVFQVLAQEQKQSFDLGGLKWELKVDRIDKDEEGNLIIIDYKTSDQKLAECLEERLCAPQLPLYCISSKKPPKAVVFGQLQAQNCKFVGLSEYSNMIPGVKEQPNWDQLLMQWKNSLETLALEFKNGEAKVSPHNLHQNCRQCRLWQLCRVKESE